MTNNVSQLVLEENIYKIEVISEAILEGYDLADEHLRLISRLSTEVGLDPTINFYKRRRNFTPPIEKLGFSR